MVFPKTVLRFFKHYRVVIIQGENGDGKTLLGLDLARYLLEAGFGYVSNFDCVWVDDPYPRVLGRQIPLDIVLHFDEGGSETRTKDTLRVFNNFKRKLNFYFMISSTEAPHEDLQKFMIYPVGFYNPFFRFWKYEINSGNIRSKWGIFCQFFPRALYGVFSTGHPAETGLRLIEWLEDEFRRYGQFWGVEVSSMLDLKLKRPLAGDSLKSDVLSRFDRNIRRKELKKKK